KATRGKSERYLKDERAREEYLIGEGLEGAVLQLADGSQRAGIDLRGLVDHARQARTLLDSIGRRYNRAIVEQAAILGALTPDILGNPEL
ncbi:hypothetical protein ABTN06_19040, partial [Acinetobacter baumannii]